MEFEWESHHSDTGCHGCALRTTGPEVAKTGPEVAESDIEDLASTQRQTIVMLLAQGAVTVSADQLHLAGQDPNRGWPAFAAVYPTVSPTDVIRDPISVS